MNLSGISKAEYLTSTGTRRRAGFRNSDAMASICDAVSKANAHLGIIFDTDVDRAGCVGADAKPINRNRLIALASFIALSDSKGGTVVTDSVTSSGLKNYIEQELQGVHW